MVLRVVEKTERSVWDTLMLYKGVVQTVLLYGRKSWMIVWVNDEVDGGVSPSYCKESHGEESLMYCGGRLKIPPNRRGYRGGGDAANSGICTEVAGKNYGIHSEKPDISAVYQGEEDVGV